MAGEWHCINSIDNMFGKIPFTNIYENSKKNENNNKIIQLHFGLSSF